MVHGLQLSVCVVSSHWDGASEECESPEARSQLVWAKVWVFRVQGRGSRLWGLVSVVKGLEPTRAYIPDMQDWACRVESPGF